jgi:hypothetical protein
MKIDDLSFEVEDGGRVYKCDVLEVVPNKKNKDEPYVVYTNYDLDDNDNFIKRYGRLINENGQFSIYTELTRDEIKYVNITREDEIVRYVNDTIEGVINE